MFFTDLHVQTLARGIMQPGEQLQGQTVTRYRPFWAMGLIRRMHLVLATNQRIVICEHRAGLLGGPRLHAIDAVAWGQVQEAKVTGLLKKKLKVAGQGDRGPVALKAEIPKDFMGFFGPMKNNLQGARAVASTYEQAKGGALPAAAVPGQLPASYPPPAQSGFPAAPHQHVA